jgi:NitT/TauT family transport system substrate-binding protein
MTRTHFLFVLALAALLPACHRANTDPQTPAAAQGDEVAVQLNWYPESEHGGLYQAAADGTFTSAGLAVELRAGGRAAPVGPELELGRCQFAMANADDVVLFRQEGLDIVAVFAAMQNHPRCILAQTASGVKTFADLSGKTFQRQEGRAFVEFMRARGILDGVQEVPYHGSVASLVADPNVVIQGYSYSEPLLARQQGVEVTTLMISELGFNPYSSVLVTSGKLIRENPQLVKQFVAAARRGWQNYLTDPSKGNQAILAANEHGMTSEALQFGSVQLRPLAQPAGMDLESVGNMTTQRWEQLVEQMVELKLVDPEKVRATECFTTEFLD